jgi:hypothetical protein
MINRGKGATAAAELRGCGATHGLQRLPAVACALSPFFASEHYTFPQSQYSHNDSACRNDQPYPTLSSGHLPNL